MGMLGLNLPPGQMCVCKPEKSVCVNIKGNMGRVGGGSCYTRVPLHSKEIAYSRGSAEDVLRFSWVNILERCVSWLTGSVLRAVGQLNVTFKAQRGGQRLKVKLPTDSMYSNY